MATAVMTNNALQFGSAPERNVPRRGAQSPPGRELDFDSIYAAYNRRVYLLCLRMVRNTTEAEDLTQEAFLHLYHKMGTFRGESAFYTWLHRLVVNVVLMHTRKRGRVQIALEDARELDRETALRRSAGRPQDSGPVSLVGRIHLQRALEKLPRGSRRVLVLHDVQGYQHHEIASMMGRSVGNSKSQLHKARRRLREILRPPQGEKSPRVQAGLASGKNDKVLRRETS